MVQKARSNYIYPEPGRDNIISYCNNWKATEEYLAFQDKENALKLLFRKFPSNENIHEVLLKVSALNDFYSTRIYNTHLVARHIVERDIDARLSKGDVSLVNDIAPVLFYNGKVRRCYSFFSKYCSFHCSDHYPIYDRYVKEILVYYNKEYNFSGVFTKKSLGCYLRFSDVVKKFQSYYGPDLSLKEIDLFLWLVGRDSVN